MWSFYHVQCRPHKCLFIVDLLRSYVVSKGNGMQKIFYRSCECCLNVDNWSGLIHVNFVYNSCWHLLVLGEIREILHNGDWKKTPLSLMSDILKRYPVPRTRDWNVEYF